MLVEDQKKKVTLSRTIPAFQLFVIICLIILIVYNVLLKTVLSGAALPAFIDMRLTIPGLDSTTHISTLLIGIVAAIVLFFYTIASIGKQKKQRRMKTRPINQLVLTIVADILIIVSSILYMKDGFPVLGAYLLVAIICFAAVSSLGGKNEKEKG